jgi:hypothetical protein
MTNGKSCEALTTAGTPCAMAPLSDSAFCWSHDPARASERAAARRRGGANSSRAGPATDPGPVDLGSAEAIRALLAEETRATLRQVPSLRRSRAVVALLTLAVKLLEVGEMEARLGALEQQLRTRRVA